MNRLLLPLILILSAIGLFVVYTNPHYQGTKALKQKVSAYDDALDKSQKLRMLRDQLLEKRGSFSPDDISKLEDIIPDNVDNIRLIIDINNIAARHSLSLKDLQLGVVSDTNTARSDTAVGSSGNAVGSVTLGFSVNATYDQFLALLADLEHSLRVVDIEKLSFSADATGRNDYDFTIRTYWLH